MEGAHIKMGMQILINSMGTGRKLINSMGTGRKLINSMGTNGAK
jgi:hypothetical protein